MPIGSSLGVTLPTTGVTGRAAAEDDIVADALTKIIAAVEGQVVVSALNMNGNLSMLSGGTRYGIQDLDHAKFYNRGSLLTAGSYPATLFWYNGQLYINDVAGNQIQATSGGTLNVSSTGGITGTGYGASGVEVNWNAAGSKYLFKSASGADAYADVECDDVRLNDGSGNFLQIQAPAMSADYSLTLPSAVSGSNNSVVQMSTAGVLSVTGTPTVDSLTAAAGGHITVSSTGRFKHGDITITIPACAGMVEDGAASWVYASSNQLWQNPGINDVVDHPIILEVGQRITAVRAYVRDTAGSNTVNFGVWQKTASSGTIAQLGSTQTSVGDGTRQTLAVTGLTTTVTDGVIYWFSVQADTATTTNHEVYGGSVTYDRP